MVRVQSSSRLVPMGGRIVLLSKLLFGVASMIGQCSILVGVGRELRLLRDHE
jgi:hypothetical protein